MIGVVLWSDPEDRQAVFWCEDQGDLAYYDGATEDAPPVVLEAGDMVRFDTVNSRRLRKARNARLVEGAACPGLPEQLRQTTTGCETSADILAFVPPVLRHDERRSPARRKI